GFRHNPAQAQDSELSFRHLPAPATLVSSRQMDNWLLDSECLRQIQTQQTSVQEQTRGAFGETWRDPFWEKHVKQYLLVYLRFFDSYCVCTQSDLHAIVSPGSSWHQGRNLCPSQREAACMVSMYR